MVLSEYVETKSIYQSYAKQKEFINTKIAYGTAGFRTKYVFKC
jgi:hypothetical protein